MLKLAEFQDNIHSSAMHLLQFSLSAIEMLEFVRSDGFGYPCNVRVMSVDGEDSCRQLY